MLLLHESRLQEGGRYDLEAATTTLSMSSLGGVVAVDEEEYQREI